MVPSHDHPGCTKPALLFFLHFEAANPQSLDPSDRVLRPLFLNGFNSEVSPNSHGAEWRFEPGVLRRFKVSFICQCALTWSCLEGGTLNRALASLILAHGCICGHLLTTN